MAEEIKTGDFQESVWAKIKMSGKDILLVGCIYKSPNSDKENLDKLNELMINTSYHKEYSHLLIMGDFNYPKLDWNSWTSNGDKEGENSWRVSEIVTYINTFWVTQEPGITVNLVL